MTEIATPSRRQAGNGRLGFIITLALFASGIFAAVKVVPVRIDAYQFREVLREEARPYPACHSHHWRESTASGGRRFGGKRGWRRRR